VCSGNCADLPQTPASRSSVATVRVRESMSPMRKTSSLMRKVPAATARVKIPNRNAMSPTRVTRNALTAAARASGQLVMVADQEVRADAHDLPADEQHEQVVGVDHEQHRAVKSETDGGVRRVALVPRR
jgi:predicted aconitase